MAFTQIVAHSFLVMNPFFEFFCPGNKINNVNKFDSSRKNVRSAQQLMGCRNVIKNT